MPDSSAPHSARAALTEQIIAFAGDIPPEAVEELRGRLSTVLDDSGRIGLTRLFKRIATTGSEWSYYPSDPLARKIHGIVGDVTLGKDSVLEGKEHLEKVRGRSAVFLANHLSYADANVLQVLLDRSGCSEVGDRLTVIVGPKVFSDPMRRFSSLCFGTVKMPQSSDRASDEAVMNSKDVARFALDALKVVDERRRAGDILLVFVEGTRSRKARMQRALAAVARYVEDSDTLLVPVGVSGSERLFPVGEERVHRTKVTVTVGPPGSAAELIKGADGKRQLMMDAVGCAIAELLPPEYRGAYGDDATQFAEARALGASVFRP
jgi:1-acyl-sn-glycerol-3-phosphate acyltransferase